MDYAGDAAHISRCEDSDSPGARTEKQIEKHVGQHAASVGETSASGPGSEIAIEVFHASDVAREFSPLFNETAAGRSDLAPGRVVRDQRVEGLGKIIDT